MSRFSLANNPNLLARSTGKLLIFARGRKINTPIKLKIKWAMARLTAASDLKIAASSAVMVVPILAPIINGNTEESDTFRVATRGTDREVVMELDCKAPVNNNPHEKDLNGLLNI